MTPEQAAAQSGAALGGFLLMMVLFAVFSFGLWLWMLINCLTRPAWSFPGGDGGSRVVWALLLFFLPFLGFLLYFLIVFLPGRQRGKRKDYPPAYYSDRR